MKKLRVVELRVEEEKLGLALRLGLKEKLGLGLTLGLKKKHSGKGPPDVAGLKTNIIPQKTTQL